MHRSRIIVAGVTSAVFVMAGLAAPSVAGAATARPAAGGGGGIVAKLKHLPGVTFLGTNKYAPKGYKVYELEIRQPVNHHQPHGATFEQHLELYQRNLNAPMVMYLSGYFNYTFLTPKDVYLSDATTITGANQLSVEHRFYGNSVPHPTLWRYLTIWQEAADEHHVVQVFKKLYTKKWLVAGVSKGGETAILHDYFYPHDFSGTFAWSAPSITQTPSPSYDNFLNSVGTASCREALVKAQIRALRHRVIFDKKVEVEASKAHVTFADWKTGGLDENMELTVLVTPFVFWQFGSDCSTVPGPSATLDQLYNWFDVISGWLASADQEGALDFTYNYEAGTQLGYPVIDERAELGSLLHYPLSAQVPQEDLPSYIPVRPLNQHLIRAIHQWVRLHGDRLLFLYGQDDPWSAQPFVLGPGSHDSTIYTIKGGNHLSPYTALPTAQEKAFVQTLRTWAGLPAGSGQAPATERGRTIPATLLGGFH
jgi:PS-10 peptidase S37